MLLNKNIKIMPANSEQYELFDLKWSFGGNSSVISLFNSKISSFSSEHWITDYSDYLSFDNNHELVSLDMSVSNYNDHFDSFITNMMYGKLILRDENYIVEPMKKRFFDPKTRRLICFTEIKKTKKVSKIKLNTNFSLIFSNDVYMGYIIDNPISYLTSDKNEEIDLKNEPDDNEYKLMAKFIDIMSDNKLELLDGDMSVLVNELYLNIMPNINLIRSDLRKKVIKVTLNELLDFYS